MPRKLSDLFGRYSLPNVMGRLGHRIGDLFHHDGNTGITPPDMHYNIDPTGGLSNAPYTPGQFGISDPYTNPNVGGDTGSYGGGQMSDPFGGGFLGGMSSGGFTGNSSGGTLGGGYAVDPGQWSQFGFGGNGPGNSVPFHTRYATGMGDGGSYGSGGGLRASGFFQHRMGTGGNLPAQGGINPGGMYTGGNDPAHAVGGMQTGGNLPAQEQQTFYGRLGGKQPPGGLMR